jgi:RNA polymerase sigma factor (sigma-70 family)
MGAAPQLAEDLFNEHYRRLYAYCLRQLGSPEEAEDAVQATYLNACRSLMAGFEPDVAQAWLFKVAQNVCLTRQRSTWRRARVERPQDLQEVQDFVAAPEPPSDELFGLDDALATLPEQQRRAILLREWQGLSYREVAAKLGLTQAAVETLIFRARRSLAAALETPSKKRRLLNAFDASALFASLKSALTANVTAGVATGVAVAASVTTLAAMPATRALDFPSHAPSVVKQPVSRKASHQRLSDRAVLAPDAIHAPSAVPKSDPKGWAGTHQRAVGKASRHAKGVHNGKQGNHSPPSQAQGTAQSNGIGHGQRSAPAYGKGGKKG